MRIVVNHLTRMQAEYICVAGINAANGQHVRPVLARGRLTPDLLALNGGPFDLAALIDLGPVQYCGYVPVLEDHAFSLRHMEKIKLLSPAYFWAVLQHVAQKVSRRSSAQTSNPCGVAAAST